MSKDVVSAAICQLVDTMEASTVRSSQEYLHFSAHLMDKVFGLHDDVIKWKYFPRYWPFVRGIHRSPVDSPHKG